MNERIKNLLNKATIKDHWSVDENRYLTHFVDQEKFAELIVIECMDCATWVGKFNTNSVEPVHTAHAIKQRIKNQLGVE